MKISEKILAHNEEVKQDIIDTGGNLAKSTGELGAEASCGGVNSRKWGDYMKLYASNPDQLKRLCGEEPAYFDDISNKRALAYIVGNSICTIDTRQAASSDEDHNKLGTLNYLTPEMIEALDAGVDTKTS